jgi:hypothetical protein
MQEDIEMRLSFRLFLIILALAIAAPPLLYAQEVIPRFMTVEPMSGKVGTEILIKGENLGKAYIAELYFTDGTHDIKTPILEETDTTIKCKIPDGVKTGVRYRLMLLTRGKEPKLIEQPVRVEIEE